MELEKIIDKIVEDTELEKDDVEEKVEEKMEEFSGLVSEEGAIHLVAKEHGVQINEAGKQEIKIKNIVPEMRKLGLKARVANISQLNTFEREGDEEEGKVQNVTLGDETDTIRMTLWDDQTQITEQISEGDAIHITGAYTVENDDGDAEIRLGDDATVKMADEGEVAEMEDTKIETTKEAKINEIRSENAQYQTQGLLVTLYTSNPFYKVDPETGNTVREDDDGNFVTDEGKEVENPEHRLALSGIIDDGTDSIRTVFFGEEARQILDIEEETEKEGDLEEIEKAADKATGKEIKVKGRTRYNDYFGRLELLANTVEETDTIDQIEEILELMEA